MTKQFGGFPSESISYLNDLRANNNKDWFDQNRDRYETCWKALALALIDALAQEMAALDPPLKAEARINGSLRRINRDVRFSPNKSPYNARLHLIFWAGSHPNRSPAFHFVLSPAGIGYGAGVFGLDAAALTSFRRRIFNPVERGALLRAISAGNQVGCTFDDPELKRVPSGFDAADIGDDWEHLMRRKSFVIRTMQDKAHPNWITNDACAPQITKLAKALMPLIRWLNA